jgi:Ubiquitin fusion degradation protein UFD1
MPASALATLSEFTELTGLIPGTDQTHSYQTADLELPGPWTFEIINASDQTIRTHAGVLEFIAEEGSVHLPQWVRTDQPL